MNVVNFCVGLFLMVIFQVAAFAAEKPNVIIIMADDMGYGDASCYGNQAFKTPELDRLAAEGMKFTDFHSSGNVCSPTRAGLLTGRYQYRAGIPGVVFADPERVEHFHGLQSEEITFAELMKSAGYATGIFGKWHLGYHKKYNPVHQGFDRFRGYVSGNVDYHSHYDQAGAYDWWEGETQIQEEGYSTHLITKHAVKFIEEHQAKPFCLYVAHEAVHSPWQGPNDPIQRGPNRPTGANRKKVDQQRAFQEMMLAMDQGIGEIRQKVTALGLEKRTLIFFFSDNGPAGGSAGPLRGRKGSNWEGGHRVPAIAWWPGTIPANSVSDELTISLDLMPTMLAMAKVDIPKSLKLDGVNLLPVLMEEKSLGQRQLFWNYKAMRDGPWKLIIGGKGTKGKNSVGLYHLSEDLGEKRNLAKKHPERVQVMQKQLAEWSADMKRTARLQPNQPDSNIPPKPGTP